jgi:NitT/TauT family transport system substrate-binding protein
MKTRPQLFPFPEIEVERPGSPDITDLDLVQRLRPFQRLVHHPCSFNSGTAARAYIASQTPVQIDTFASEGQCRRFQGKTPMPHRRRFAKAILLLGLVAQLPFASNASAEVVRFGKPVAGAFTFALLDVGVRAGIFKRHGLDIEISAFTGGTRLVQAETAGSIDIAFNTGPDMAMIFKGAPVRAVALVSDSPLDLCLLVRPDLAVTAPADLKGKRITVSSPFAMTAWMTRELARQEGWSSEGIQLVASASGPAFALLKTKDIDGITTDLGSGLQAQKRGDAKVIVRFSERVKNLTMYVIFASEKMIAEQPDTVRRFLAAWFETLDYVSARKGETLQVAREVTNHDEDIVSELYDLVLPLISRTGRFEQKSLDTLAGSYVDLKLLPAKPDMGKTYTEQFLVLK